jgi:hypothetical protein
VPANIHYLAPNGRSFCVDHEEGASFARFADGPQDRAWLAVASPQNAWFAGALRQNRGALLAMGNRMTAEHTRRTLLAQHERLRDHIRACTRLAKIYRATGGVGTELDAALELLREEFAAHNEAETTVIRRLLHGPATWSVLMIDRMFEEHVAEHAVFWDLLSQPRDEVAERIDDLADEPDEK